MKATYYTHKELAKHCAEARKKGVKDTIDILVMLSAWAAWDVLNANEEQLKAILEFMTRKCEYVLAKEFTFVFEQFGKTVFLTREEAESALKERL